MKGLAQFVMRGRLQALLIAVAGAGSLLFCWISAAVIALVTLRKGAMDGVSLLFWALLPAGTLWFLFGDSGPLALLLGTTILALVLRETVSLPLAVLAGVGVGVATGLVTLFIDGELVAQLVAYFDELLAQWEAQLSQGEEAVILPRPDARQVAGLLGAGTATLSVLCMMLARYWQAQLYNPDGFGLEFRALRYPPMVTLVLVAAALVLSGLGLQMRTWAVIFFIPLTFAGLALVHARAVRRGSGSSWLGFFYVAWLLFDPIKLLVVVFAIADSWLDFRQRWAETHGSPPSGGSGGPDKRD